MTSADLCSSLTITGDNEDLGSAETGETGDGLEMPSYSCGKDVLFMYFGDC